MSETQTHVRPETQSKLHYFQLSRKFNKEWLSYLEYRNLLWYWTQYEEIYALGEFDEKLIKNRQG